MGKILKIQRFCTDDGDGIRTTVFFKGCPLRCVWCHNPESQKKESQIGFDPSRCVSCGRCVSVCENGCHVIAGGRIFHRELCDGCGKCVSPVCEALELFGYEAEAEEIMDTVTRDKEFYASSGGGLTLSGGEPLAQWQFALEILTLAKANGINTAIETCGYGSSAAIDALLPYVDTFLYDIKETDDARHRELTGVSNALILENLRCLSERGARIVLRCPIIPDLNDRDGHFAAIGKLAELDGVIRVEVEPYHSFGEGKYGRLDMAYTLSGAKAPDDSAVEGYVKKISGSCKKPVIRLR